eukprot:m.846464 g.846464  ORF g.846464 m.846464 type:complete len:67 (-) comp59560_c0_seq7:100-300(-)
MHLSPAVPSRCWRTFAQAEKDFVEARSSLKKTVETALQTHGAALADFLPALPENPSTAAIYISCLD